MAVLSSALALSLSLCRRQTWKPECLQWMEHRVKTTSDQHRTGAAQSNLLAMILETEGRATGTFHRAGSRRDAAISDLTGEPIRRVTNAMGKQKMSAPESSLVAWKATRMNNKPYKKTQAGLKLVTINCFTSATNCNSTQKNSQIKGIFLGFVLLKTDWCPEPVFSASTISQNSNTLQSQSTCW